MAGNTVDLHLHVDDCDNETDQEEDALSLCDFPLGLDDDDHDQNPKDENENDELGKLRPARGREGAAAVPEFFEFFSDRSSEMCAAADIIFCGKIIPVELPPLQPPPQQKQQEALISIQPHKRQSFDDEYEYGSRRRNNGVGLGKRSESLSELCTRTRTTSTSCHVSTDNKSALLRNSRSLDYHRHERRRCDVESNSSMGSAGKSSVSPAAKGGFKSRWYGFMFGKDKFTPEMELRDIKTRHSRRIQSLTSSPREVEDGADSRSSGKAASSSSSWGFLKALSCTDHTNVAVTPSLCVPHA